MYKPLHAGVQSGIAHTLRSMRPGRMRAGSRVSGRFVAISTCEGQPLGGSAQRTLESGAGGKALTRGTDWSDPRYDMDFLSRKKTPREWSMNTAKNPPPPPHQQQQQRQQHQRFPAVGRSATHLDVTPAVEAVQLVHNLKHGALDLVVPAAPVIKPRATDRVHLHTTTRTTDHTGERANVSQVEAGNTRVRTGKSGACMPSLP